ncbi:hypothetical protein BDV37DRAFT_239071 [Aspergillus pseudonomiae]|uniref:Uncharacterized protein n=1 Tax=Aspergillus pseudonomiae TaxID=1506151 RepID=A0A5N7DP22_9EURO|nr:uncharacterized protein BDV37DRAFT_239071 [Aspergillus pseudonomiae]KAE8408210.1 hypothetical protein BDV37DRAFT_239071 [Aspergillus pseudonomiae]
MRIRWGQDVMTRIPMMAATTVINADHLRDGGGELSIPGILSIFQDTCGDCCSHSRGIYNGSIDAQDNLITEFAIL